MINLIFRLLRAHAISPGNTPLHRQLCEEYRRYVLSLLTCTLTVMMPWGFPSTSKAPISRLHTVANLCISTPKIQKAVVTHCTHTHACIPTSQLRILCTASPSDCAFLVTPSDKHADTCNLAMGNIPLFTRYVRGDTRLLNYRSHNATSSHELACWTAPTAPRPA